MYASDGEQSDHSEESDYSRGSWYNVPTPLPSPPRSPPPNQEDADPSKDEEGFRNVDAVDYREYERWYGEDNLGEDEEMREYTCTFIYFCL
jgi:hypothetical protein